MLLDVEQFVSNSAHIDNALGVKILDSLSTTPQYSALLSTGGDHFTPDQ